MDQLVQAFLRLLMALLDDGSGDNAIIKPHDFLGVIAIPSNLLVC